MPLPRLALTLAIGLLATACATIREDRARPADGPAVAAWVTTGDQTRRLSRDDAPLALGATAAQSGDNVITVDDARRYQAMSGFGASITDASAWLIHHRMSEAQRNALLQELFDRDGGGIGFDVVRLTIGASDFSLRHYSLADRPAGETDLPLAHFSIEPLRAELLPVVRQALAVNPRLQVMASPWSAPGWMKTNDSLIQGSLRPDMHDAFARYLLRFVEAMRAEGVPIFALTLQNEPLFAPGDYPGMLVDAPARARLIGQHLGPLLARHSPGTQIIEWDHNWDAPQEPLAVLADPDAHRHISGVGWHCYVADTLLPNQSVVRDKHPDKDVWLTECSGGAWKPRWGDALATTARNLVIRSTRHWARGVLMWNLALDEQHGPRLGGCKDCHGIVTIDSRTGEVTRSPEYYAFAHASKFVRPGARRIETSPGGDGIDNVAFRNEDGTIALVVGNSATAERRFVVQHAGRAFAYRLPRESVATFVWRP